MAATVSEILPRVLIVSRRSVRKNKFVDFVGEYHLDLIVKYGAAPIIVPRVSEVHNLLDSFEPIHGVLLCEGEDIDPSLYQEPDDASNLTSQELQEIRKLHSSDTTIDKEKDTIELKLARLCLERNIPYLGICRGSQLLNVACGGTLYQDIGKEVTNDLPKNKKVVHMNYDDYDGHRHPIRVVGNTPLHKWFGDCLDDDEGKMELLVSSYHHQGVKKLAKRFVPMAFAPDGLIEGFYDPNLYNSEEGKFLVGLQFHPERMRKPNCDEFDYSGCPIAYKDSVKAVVAYQRKIHNLRRVPKALKLNGEMEKKRKTIVRSFSLARDMHQRGHKMRFTEVSELEPGVEFFELNSALSVEQELRLNQMGATVANATSYFERLKLDESKEKLARNVMEKMSVENLSDLMAFYHMMGKISSEILEGKLHDTRDNALGNSIIFF